jgi:hypothetical protein
VWLYRFAVMLDRLGQGVDGIIRFIAKQIIQAADNFVTLQLASRYARTAAPTSHEVTQGSSQ